MRRIPKWQVHLAKLTNECPEKAPPQVKAMYEGLRWALLQESAMLAQSVFIPERWVRLKLREMADTGLLETKQEPMQVFKYYAKDWFDYITRW